MFEFYQIKVTLIMSPIQYKVIEVHAPIQNMVSQFIDHWDNEV